MSSAYFVCKYCMSLCKVPVTTMQRAYALRCDKCQASTALSERQRSALLDLANPPVAAVPLEDPTAGSNWRSA
jgi:transcription elongation factor Elf1